MKAVYIGILQPGSTSRMRAESLRKLTPEMDWEWIDTDLPMRESGRLWRALAFRYRRGRASERINRFVVDSIANLERDLVWVDKGVFLYPSTIRRARSLARRLVHYTPDSAFLANQSRHFDSSIDLYDLLVTTKSFEIDEYHRRVGAAKTLLTTQGYDADLHFPRADDHARRREAVFVGFAEPNRELCISTLLEAGISVRLGGKGWKSFERRWRHDRRLVFEGEEIFGDAYATLLSTCWVGLGLISKRIPELHTTRTFEIPACGGVLATEATVETRRFFQQDEALFFHDYSDLARNLGRLFNATETSQLSELAAGGINRVHADGRDNASILAAILADSRLLL